MQDAHAGCTLLGQINEELDWPSDLSVFGVLAHDQYGHEKYGMSAQDCVPEIIEGCKVLVEKYS